MVTQFIAGRRHRKGENIFHKLGDLLGCLHCLSLPATGGMKRKGGAWHHICYPGGLREEIDAAIVLLDSIKVRVDYAQAHLFDALRNRLQQADDLGGLPQSFNHPDFVPSNSITSTADDSIWIIDWTGAGMGPRISALGYLLWAAGNRSMAQVEAVTLAYIDHISLQGDEIARLKSAIVLLPLILRCWEVCTERRRLEDVMGQVVELDVLGDKIAGVAQRAIQRAVLGASEYR